MASEAGQEPVYKVEVIPCLDTFDFQLWVIQLCQLCLDSFFFCLKQI